MPSYLHPGVYMEEVPSGARPIESVGTSTAAIIGYTAKGPVDTPSLIFNWKDYQEQFGGFFERSDGEPDYMSHSVRAFFDNGGGKAYICRVADSSATEAKGHFALPKSSGTINSGTNLKTINFDVIGVGDWANSIVTSVSEMIPSSKPPKYKFTIYDQASDGTLEEWESVSGISYDGAATPAAALTAEIERVQEELTRALTLVRITGNNSKSISNIQPDRAPSYIDRLVDTTPTSSTTFPLDGTFQIKLDGSTNPINVTITSAVSLEIFAAQVQSQVRSDINGNLSFRCFVDGSDDIVMQSLSLTKESKVVTSAVATSLSAVLTAATSLPTGAAAYLASQATETFAKVTTDGVSGPFPRLKADYDEIFNQLRKISDINIMLTPGHSYEGTSIDIISSTISHATEMGNRMVIIDPPDRELISADDVAGFGPPTSEYTALYHPWMEVINPNYHPEKNNAVAKSYSIPPSGFAAGLWARTDGSRGVWKAPAGVGATVFGSLRPRYVVGNDEQDQLNPEGVNCIRKILTQPVIWGARTLATRAVPAKRYVPVQRTTLMIKESIYQGIQWAVFEPNDHNLWASLRLNIEAFMDGLHRAGAFQGEKASDAYFVRCGLGQTMTQGDIDAGRVIVEVGFAPLKPAEFVIVRLSQKTAQ